MLRIFLTFISLIVITIFFTSCEQENMVNTVPSNTTLNKGAVVQSATGSGHFLVSGELRVFTFNAKVKADGSVSGHFNLYRHDIGSHVGGSVICLNFDGNKAYFAGFIEVSNEDEGLSFSIGHYVIWSAIDNGEGANYPPDQISLIYGNPSWTQADVESSFDSYLYGYFNVEDGNIQVH